MQFGLWCSMNSNDDVYPSGNKVIMSDFNGANVCDSSGRPRQHYSPLPFILIIMGIAIGVRANIHLGGGKPSFARMDSVGGGGGWVGGVADIFQDP